MVIIKHSNKPMIKHKYFRTSCSCGCTFDFSDEECFNPRPNLFSHFPTKRFTFCPECGATIREENYKEISEETYKHDLDYVDYLHNA